MEVDIKNELLIDQVSAEELEILLLNYFHESSYIGENKTLYGDNLIVEYYKKSGKIKSIYLSNKGEIDLCENLKKECLNAFSKTNKISISRRIIFSLVEINGVYRFKNEFQILPPPNNWPKPSKSTLFAKHPLILEFAYEKSNNTSIDMHRSDKKFYEIFFMLNAFLKHGVTGYKFNPQSNWVVVSCENNQNSYKTIEAHFGYQSENYEKTKIDQYGFMIFDKKNTIPTKDRTSYYSDCAITIGEKLSLPDKIEDLLLKFYSLSSQQKNNFIRSSYWKNVSSETLFISLSNSYIALINAIESLLPENKVYEVCSKCGKDNRKSITQLFHDFVEDNCPGVDSMTRKKLYAIRSKYAHGKQLAPHDILSNCFRSNPLQQEEMNKYRVMSQILQIAMINWLIKITNSTKKT